MTSIDTLTARQIVAVYNHHAPAPVARFENSTKARRRLRTLLSGLDLKPADAIAAVYPATPDHETSRMLEQVEISNAKFEAYQADAIGAAIPELAPPPPPPVAPAPEPVAVAGKARALIVAACSRPEGATSAELFATTGWKFASWSHQLKLITKQTGVAHEIRKVDGTTRYFLLSAKA